MRNWAARSIGSGGWSAITWNGSMFCAVSDDDYRSISFDGLTWNTAGLGTSVGARSVAWSGTVFCVVGGTGTPKCATSPNGTAWTARTIPAGGAGTVIYNAVTWSGSVFCAVGYGTTGRCATSPDGITWTSQSIPSGSWRAILWNGSMFIALGYGGACATSPDGVTWTSRAALPNGRDYRSLAFSGGAYCAIHDQASNSYAISTDGIAWAEREMPQPPADAVGYPRQRMAIIWTGAIFVAVEATGGSSACACYTSPDGYAWTAISTGMPGAAIGYNALAFDGHGAVAVGYNIAAQSMLT
jgi:hypothetical protein